MGKNYQKRPSSGGSAAAANATSRVNKRKNISKKEADAKRKANEYKRATQRDERVLKKKQEWEMRR